MNQAKRVLGQAAAMEQPLLQLRDQTDGEPGAFRGIRKQRDPSPVRTWLYSIVRAVIVNGARRDMARERAEQVHVEPFDEGGVEPFTAAEASDVHRALNDLDARHREVLALRFLEDFSLEETAQITSYITPNERCGPHYQEAFMNRANDNLCDGLLALLPQARDLARTGTRFRSRSPRIPSESTASVDG
jgi:hypothetical protein